MPARVHNQVLGTARSGSVARLGRALGGAEGGGYASARASAMVVRMERTVLHAPNATSRATKP